MFTRKALRAGFFYSALASSLIYAGLYAKGAKDYDSLCARNAHGQFNRAVDYAFVKEFGEGIRVLNAACRNKPIVGAHTGNVVSLDIFVSDTVKSFFDDSKNSFDDDVWIKQTIDCLDGLKKFSEFGGIEFKVNKFVGVFEDVFVGKPKTSPEFIDSLQTRVRAEQESHVVVYLRAGYLKHKSDGYSASRLVGHSDYPASLALVNLNNSVEINQLIIAHEVAHIFGASHTTGRTSTFMKIKCLSVPSYGYFFSGDIMEPIVNDLSPQSDWAKQTFDEVNANKYRFVGRK